MALILCIETATSVCSVGLTEDNKVIECIETKEEKSHASQISIFIQDILQKHSISAQQLDAVAVSMGPGSYTGLRIGVSVAKGICFAGDIPLIAIDTLRALCYNIMQSVDLNSCNIDEENILFCPMLDARRMEVYTCVFNSKYKKLRNVSAEIIDESSFSDILKDYPVLFFGSGSLKCKDIITHHNAIFIDNIDSSACKMTFFANEAYKKKEFVDVAYFEPFYLKEFQTTTPKNKIFK